MNIPPVNLSRQFKVIKKDVKKAVLDVFSRGDFVLGESVEKFEQEFADFCGVKHCIGVASGTDALLLSLRALGIGAGDEVISVPFTFISTILPITYLGAKPVLVDINSDTYQIDIKKLKQAITKKTKAIIPVHLFGIPAQVDEIRKIAKENNLYVIEDACQAHGAMLNGKKCGSFGDIAAFSFYPTKSLGASGDAGAITTNNKQLADNIRAMRNVGQIQRYKHDLLGYNSRLDAIHACVLSVKLKKLNQWNERRKELAQLYDKYLSSLPVILPPIPTDKFSPNYVLYVIRIKERDKLLEYLKDNGIGCVIYYPIPVHLQKALKYLGYKKGDFPVAERCAKEVLSLPIYPELRKSEVRFICLKIKEFFALQS